MLRTEIKTELSTINYVLLISNTNNEGKKYTPSI